MKGLSVKCFAGETQSDAVTAEAKQFNINTSVKQQLHPKSPNPTDTHWLKYITRIWNKRSSVWTWANLQKISVRRSCSGVLWSFMMTLDHNNSGTLQNICANDFYCAFMLLLYTVCALTYMLYYYCLPRMCLCAHHSTKAWKLVSLVLKDLLPLTRILL